MISWRKYVDHVDDTGVHLNCPDTDIRFSYLQPDEVLLARDILNKQIVDTQGMKVVRVNDIKFSVSGENQLQLRLLGAEVGARGLLRAIHPALERAVERIARRRWANRSRRRHRSWSYMDLLERSTQNIKLSVSHKTLDELHPPISPTSSSSSIRACAARCLPSSTPPRPPRPSPSSTTTSSWPR